jgi:hypothetical protein
MLATFRIYGRKGQILSFDLSDLLRLLAPRSVRATWVISTVKSSDPDREWFEATGEGGEQLEILAREKAVIPGLKLSTLAEKTRQIIWGEFVASLSGHPEEKWMTIRAIDSMFYEITTSDEVVLRKLKSTLEDVRQADPWFI